MVVFFALKRNTRESNTILTLSKNLHTIVKFHQSKYSGFCTTIALLSLVTLSSLFPDSKNNLQVPTSGCLIWRRKIYLRFGEEF